MTAQISPSPIFKGWANDGTPLAYGLLYSYAAGTTTPQATYIDSTQTTPNTNPIILNARGECALWLDPALSYKFNLTDSKGNQISGYPVDNITSDASLPIDSLNVHYDITQAETSAGVVPIFYNYPPYRALRYYSGSGDATAAINDAASASAKAGYGMAYIGTSRAALPAIGPIVIDTNATGFDFEGAFINASATTTGYWLTPIQSAPDINQRTALNAAHPIQNFLFGGPGRGTTNCCIFLNDTTGSPSRVIAGIVFRNGGLLDWGTCVSFGDGAFMTTFDTCNFSTSTGGAPDSVYGIISAAAANAGESLKFVNCVMNNRNYGISQSNGNSDIDWQGGSLDYMTTFMNVTAGKISFKGQLEGSSDIALTPWVNVTGANSVLNILPGSTLTITGNKPLSSPFNVDSSVTTGRLSIEGTLLAMGAGLSLGTNDLVSGTGNFNIRGLEQYESANHPPFGPYMNRLAYGDFESTSYTGDWTLTNGAIRSTAQHHTGTASLSFPSTSGATAQAQRSFPVTPGSVVNGRLWYLYPTRTNGTLFGQWAWLDNSGVIIGSAVNILSITASTGTTWAFMNIGATDPSPPGAVSIQYTFNLFGVLTGTETGYIDDVQIGIAFP